MSMFKQGKKEDLGGGTVDESSSPQSLERSWTMSSWKHFQSCMDVKVIGNIQCRFTKGNSSLTNLATVRAEMTACTDERRVLAGGYIDFSEDFDPVRSR